MKLAILTALLLAPLAVGADGMMGVGSLMQPSGMAGAPPAPSFAIITESGDKIITESGDAIRTETP